MKAICHRVEQNRKMLLVICFDTHYSGCEVIAFGTVSDPFRARSHPPLSRLIAGKKPPPPPDSESDDGGGGGDYPDDYSDDDSNRSEQVVEEEIVEEVRS